MAARNVIRQIGDTQAPIGSTLTRRNGDVVNLTGMTVNFAMYETDGTVKTAAVEATIVLATAGTVEYDFQAADVATAGTFYAYFITVDGGEEDTFPVTPGDLAVIVKDTIPAAVTVETTYPTLRTEIADFLGYTRNGEWSVDERARLDSILNSGYRQFIYPIPLEGESVAHRWSFLQPTATFDTVASTYKYDMPTAFGAIIGDLIYDEDENVHRIIEQTTPGVIDRNRAVNDAEGRPYLFALRPKAVAMTSLQTTELMLYPTADAAYGIVYHFDAKVDPITSTNLYPLGGQAHSETILQSCRDMAAAQYKDDPGGLHHGLFLERLRASVEADRRLSPKTLGFNNDGRKIIHTRHGSSFTVTHGSMP